MINNKNNAFRNSISEISWLNTMINEIYIYINVQNDKKIYKYKFIYYFSMDISFSI